MQETQEKTQITSSLHLKFIAAYFKRAHKDSAIRVQQCEEDKEAFYLADGFLSMKVPFHSDLYPYTFGWPTWERATFPKGEVMPQEGGADQAAMWRQWGNTQDNYTLTLTPFLLEQPRARNKPGEFARKLTASGFEVYIDKYMMDMLNPDLDELKGFFFETSGHEKPVRVSAVNGIVGYLMPKCNIQRYLEVNY